MPPRNLEKDKLVTFQVASYAYAQIGMIQTGVCYLVWCVVNKYNKISFLITDFY